MPDPLFIDNFGPLPIVRPASAAELGDLVRRAAAAGQSVYPVGGGTMLHVGLPPARPGVAVDVRSLDTVIDYPARDMTITVGAGITLARLDEILRGENQRLPVDVPLPGQATLGGALAVSASGPRRYGFGTLRDYVIGISAVNDEGHEIKAGGRVVKNVAGYDLCKLFIGSLGTPGVITRVTLKVRPRPEAQAMLVGGCPAVALADLLERLHTSATRPVCIDVRGPAEADADFQVFVGFEENRQAVDWQVKQIQQELRPGYSLLVRRDADAEQDFRRLTDATLNSACALSFKANLLPSAVAGFLRKAREIVAGPLQAHAGNGIVIGHVGGDLTAERAAAMLASLQEPAAAAQGNVIVLRCPPEWKRSLPVWGAPRGDLRLMRAVKDKLDPRRLFNPGRFVDGI